MRLGIFGGTFDPPHIGHLILTDEVIHQMELDLVYWVLTPYPPHKTDQYISPLDQRITMLQAAIGDDEKNQLSYVDIDRPEPHYSSDTVKIFRENFPHDNLVFLMGGDSIHDLPLWHKPFELLEYCDSIAVMKRPGYEFDLLDMESKIPGLSPKVNIIEAPLISISSHSIRERVHCGRPYKWLLPKKVYELIEKNSYYIQSLKKS